MWTPRLVCLNVVLTFGTLLSSHGQSKKTDAVAPDKLPSGTSVPSSTAPIEEREEKTLLPDFVVNSAQDADLLQEESERPVAVAERQKREQVKRDFAESQSSLITKSRQMAQFATPSGAPGYRLDDFRGTVEATREELLGKLQGQDRAGMRDYVRQSFPSKIPSGIGSPEGVLVPLPEADYALRLMLQFIEKVQSASLSAVDVEIVSAPTGARAVLSVSDGAPDREAISNGSIKNLYRGRYHYAVTKPGFKNAVGPLDLVDNPGIKLECQMVSIADANASTQCTQR